MLYLYHVNTFTYHELSSDILIGRTTGQLIFSDDGRMSGKHALISVHETNGQLSVLMEDLGSKNVSVVNRSQIPSFQKIKIKPLALMEVGSQQFILTENKSLSLDTLNAIMDHNMNKPIVKIEKDHTSNNLNVPSGALDPIAAKEKSLQNAEKELERYETNAKAELAKLDESREKLITAAKIKRAELSRAVTTLKNELDSAKAEKMDVENKMKKIINIKGI